MQKMPTLSVIQLGLSVPMLNDCAHQRKNQLFYCLGLKLVCSQGLVSQTSASQLMPSRAKNVELSKLVQIKRAAFRSMNTILKIAGLKIDILTSDADSITTDEYCVEYMSQQMAGILSEWLEKQTLFELRGDTVSAEDVAEFFRLWLHSPYNTTSGGSRFNNLCSLFALAKAYKPDTIIDSGTYQGASAWALKQGCKRAHILSFDIDLSQMLARESEIEYHEMDWTQFNFQTSAGRTLAYFDDHVDQVQRLLEAREVKVDVAIFDDDFNLFSFARMAPTVGVLPKVEFALDDQLKDGQTIVWKYRGKPLSFTIDRDYLDRGRAVIEATQRMADTSTITGIQQTPYRIVKLRSG